MNVRLKINSIWLSKKPLIPVGILLSVFIINIVWECLFSSDMMSLKTEPERSKQQYSQHTLNQIQTAQKQSLLLSRLIRLELQALQRECEEELFIKEFGWRGDRCHAVVGMFEKYDLEALKRILPNYDLQVKKILQKKSVYYVHVQWDLPST